MAAKSKSLWGFTTSSLLLGAVRDGDGRKARVLVRADKKSKQATRLIEADDGSVTLHLNPAAVNEAETDPRLKTSLEVKLRDLVGASLGQLERLEVGQADYDFDLDEKLLKAALLGLEIASYRFKRVFASEPNKVALKLNLKGKPLAAKAVETAVLPGIAVNLARHLVNLPPNLLNPVTYASALSEVFSGMPGMSVEIWDEKRLAKEGMGMHVAVGQGSQTPARLLHLRYRPSGAAKDAVAFVGKGITFDSGGLDIKPASGMRLMKKDMGGSAAVAGLALWAATSKLKTALDFYLPMAENSIGSKAFRPSDILTARNGTTVEIHNTDAEGRLVLGDSLALAAEAKPIAIIDVATLTGAIKVALGANLAGLFTNDARLGESLSKAGQAAGDPAWIMPLVQRYRGQMGSFFADQTNATDGFGGAITAALFLEKFSEGIPWAHLDIYAWKDSSDGCLLEAGGSGQSVLGLVSWLASR